MNIALKPSPNDVFLNVRKAFRLLHDYHCMVRDAVRYIGSQMDIQEHAGWPKFADDAKGGGYRYLWQPSWDWLPMMQYEFLFRKTFGGEEFLSLSFVVISDTGFIEGGEAVSEKEKLSAYAPTDQSSTKFAFILRRGAWDPLPFIENKVQMRNFIKVGGCLPDKLVTAGFVGKCYDMSCLSNEANADNIVKDIIAIAQEKSWPLELKKKLQ